MEDLNKLSLLEKISKVWQIQLNIEYCESKKNTRISFKDIGSFCEILAINYNADFVGCGSGGMGLDLVNYKTGKAVEVKSCCTIQNARCKHCGSKFNSLFVNTCPKCKSKDYEDIDDSRFGIDAKEFLNQYGKGFFENFTMCYISLVKHDISNKKIIVKQEWFTIDFSDDKIRDIQLKYFKTQADKGSKPHCNLVPYKYDFYKLCPKKIDDKNIEIDYGDLNVAPKIYDCSFDEDLRVPIDLIPIKNRKLFMALDSFTKSVDGGSADAKDFTMHMDYKKKAHGKRRGDTRDAAYSPTKKGT